MCSLLGYTEVLHFDGPSPVRCRLRLPEVARGASTELASANLGQPQPTSHRLPKGPSKCSEGVFLLEEGADVNAAGGYYGNALQAVCTEGGIEIMRLFLEKGADVKYGNALHAGCAEGHTDTVRLLLKGGADVNAAGDYGKALQGACAAGHKEIPEASSSVGSSAATSKSATASSASNAAASGSPSVSGSAAGASASAAADLTPCALSCVTLAAANSSCLSLCVCTDANFQAKAASCLMGECKSADSTAALALQASQCGQASLSAMAKPTATASFLPPNSLADISSLGSPFAGGSGASGSPSTSSGSNGALRLGSAGLNVAAAVALVGGMVGAVVVL
ncbi:hypothetical protein C8R44DRAFT_880892 [Mycena epipterygia]|nr:hypothetical protein C8R44DRAFT_880892 [Mycena epipterygia]